MNHLLQLWPGVARRIREARAIALFLDFDGTLAPFVSQPSAARLPWPARRMLLRLSSQPRLRIWIVSARRREDLRSRVTVPRLQYLGLYGWENGALPRFPKNQRRMLAKARAELAGGIRRIPGVWIEDKDATFALHWRNAAPEEFHLAAGVFQSVMAPFEAGLRVMPGDHVWEVTPAGLPGKGVAARLHWRAWRGDALPVYVGDNAADELAFAALASGITVCVGPARDTRAHFRLRDPGEVRTFLERLEREIG